MKKFLKLAAPVVAIAAAITVMTVRQSKKRVRKRPRTTDIPIN